MKSARSLAFATTQGQVPAGSTGYDEMTRGVVPDWRTTWLTGGPGSRCSEP